MKKLTILIFFTLIFQTATTAAYPSWVSYGGNPTYSNYFEGKGNITYPHVSFTGKIRGISRTLLSADINGDGSTEIIGVSLLDNSLYVFNNSLYVLWSFRENNDTLLNTEKVSFSKISAITIGNITGDSKPEILFSICDGRSNFSLLHAFSFNGKEMWRKKIDGRITQQSLFVGDIDFDGKNEIICGGTKLNILNGNGEIKYEYRFNINKYEGVSEILFIKDYLFVGLWSSSDVFYASRSNFYRAGDEFYLFKMRIENSTTKILWEKTLEKGSSTYYVYQSDNNFKIYIRRNKGHASLECMNMYDGSLVWRYNTEFLDLEFLPLSISKNSEIFWSIGGAVISLTADGKLRWQRNATGPYTPDQYTGTISSFDADNDGNDEIIVIKYSGEMECLDSKKGNLKWKLNIYQNPRESIQYFDYTPVIIHADTDNDGFDEIITTDPEGRIVIIDNGTPPKENKGISMEMLVLTGIGTIITASAVIWIWRKKRNERK